LLTGFVGGPPARHDWNKFDVPGLRGISRTAPYFHNNSAATLEEVVDHYIEIFKHVRAVAPPGPLPRRFDRRCELGSPATTRGARGAARVSAEALISRRSTYGYIENARLWIEQRRHLRALQPLAAARPAALPLWSRRSSLAAAPRCRGPLWLKHSPVTKTVEPGRPPECMKLITVAGKDPSN
jgi:hypothetical protein